MNRARLLPLVTVAVALAATGCATSDTRELTFVHTVDVSHPVHRCGVEVFTSTIEEQTDGAITFDVFPSGQLGSEQELADSVIAGDLDMTQPSAGHASNYYSALSVLNAAFLFDGYEDMFKIADSEVGADLWAGLREKTGLEVLGVWPQGIRHVTTASDPVRAPEDLRGVTMRAADAPIWIANIDALGATPTPMALGELYSGLQQGVVDAQENPVNLIRSNSFDEVQNYIALTAHVVQGNPLVINGDTWASLSEDEQRIFAEAGDVSSRSLRDCLVDEAETILDGWRENGRIQIVEDIDREAFRDRASSILLTRFAADWDGFYESIRAELDGER